MAISNFFNSFRAFSYLVALTKQRDLGFYEKSNIERLNGSKLVWLLENLAAVGRKIQHKFMMT